MGQTRSPWLPFCPFSQVLDLAHRQGAAHSPGAARRTSFNPGILQPWATAGTQILMRWRVYGYSETTDFQESDFSMRIP